MRRINSEASALTKKYSCLTCTTSKPVAVIFVRKLLSSRKELRNWGRIREKEIWEMMEMKS